MNILPIVLKTAGVVTVLVALANCGGQAPAAAPTAAPAAAPTARPTEPPVPTARPAEPPVPTVRPTEPPMPTAAPAEEDGGGSPVTSTTLDSGDVRYEVQDASFAITLPASWLQVDVRPETFKEGIDEVAKQNPEFGKVLGSQLATLTASNVRFFAFDQVPDAMSAGYITNVNVIRQDLGLEVPLEMLMPATVQQLEGLSNVQGQVDTETVKTAAGDAAKLQYKLTLATADGADAEVRIVQFLVIKGTSLYVVSMGTLEKDAETYLPLFQQIGESFELMES